MHEKFYFLQRKLVELKKKGSKKGLINTSAIGHVYNSSICPQSPWDVEDLRLEDSQKQGKRTVELDEKKKRKNKQTNKQNNTHKKKKELNKERKAAVAVTTTFLWF